LFWRHFALASPPEVEPLMVTDREPGSVPSAGAISEVPAYGITVPVVVIACWVPGTFNAFVVIVTLSLSGDDGVVGVKLMVSVQLAKPANVVVEVQSLVAPLFSGKSGGKLIAEKFNPASPELITFTTFGLSLLVEPTLVAAKFTVGGSAKSSFSSLLL